jgi:hypothetical protein
VLQFFPASIISPLFHTHTFIHYCLYIILTASLNKTLNEKLFFCYYLFKYATFILDMLSINQYKLAACSVCWRKRLYKHYPRTTTYLDVIRTRFLPIPKQRHNRFCCQCIVSIDPVLFGSHLLLSVCMFDELLIISSVFFTGPWNGDLCRLWLRPRLTFGQLAYLQSFLTESACFTIAAYLCHWHINTVAGRVRNWRFPCTVSPLLRIAQWRPLNGTIGTLQWKGAGVAQTGVVSRLWTGQRGLWSNSRQDQLFLYSPKPFARPRSPPSLLFNGYCTSGSVPGVKAV